MYGQTIITSLLPLLSLSLALPLEPRDTTTDFTLTSLGATFPYSGVYGDESVNSHVNVGLSYPDPSSTSGATLNTTCSVSWPAGTNPGPTAWTPCADGKVQFRLPTNGWTSTTNFRVEFWEQLNSDGSGLEATHYIQMDPSNPSNPAAVMFCLQMGKFNPLTCSLTGPYGQTPRTVSMAATEESAIPS
ncbi:uncharacterized protein GGS22DRAFT_155049 [Annulohypoxylon maeteangense]|uniref:uncharacterized protein n=1 Tax=Annulohypoxylon maeteangense TaxID=1927788 RepID=UPI0020079BA4|nr:uncharacterized protein GGS22DRAFT_155049 [Annulohypoxylon maeteangense]KAI0888080.1 hypothetical protein GGS22DRAFT_155049 [Annulohypoxylon maeteangense]